MNKKSIIVGIIVAVMVALIVVVFAMSSNVEKVSKDIIATVDGVDYDITEFKDYMYIKNEADGDISKRLTTEEIDTMFNEFLETKIYVSAANKKGITIPSEEEETFKEEYQAKADTYASYNVSEADYIRFASDEYKQTELSNNFSAYYELPEEYYNSFVESYTDDKKSYEYRIMMFGYNEEVSGDASGDASGDTTSNSEKSRSNVLAKVENVLAEVRNSGDFEALAKENASYRLAFEGAGYTFVNGGLEYATSPILESKLGNTDLYNAFLNLNSGDTTDVIEDTEGRAFYIAKLENVQDGFTGKADEELRTLILLQYAETLILQDVKYEINAAAAMRVFYNY